MKPSVASDLANQSLSHSSYSVNITVSVFSQHYICNHDVEIPVMAVVYSLSSLQRVSHSSREYAEEMKKLQENIQLEWRRKVKTMLSACISLHCDQGLISAVGTCLMLVST